QQSIALELIDAASKNREIPTLILDMFREIHTKHLPSNVLINDHWLNNYIHKIESNEMDSIYTLMKLRKVELFKNLPAETLQVLSGCCLSKDMVKGEIIFNEGEQGDGMYIIDSGEVIVTK